MLAVTPAVPAFTPATTSAPIDYLPGGGPKDDLPSYADYYVNPIYPLPPWVGAAEFLPESPWPFAPYGTTPV